MQFGVREIPEKYVKKRWTKKARESIPEHLKGYVNDNEASASRTYRHDLIYQTALDMVRIGDTNTETYQKTMEVMCNHLKDLKLMTATAESSTKETRQSERLQGKKPIGNVFGDHDAQLCNDNCIDECEATEGGDDDWGGEEVQDEEMEDGVRECDILPPEFRRGRGRPRMRRYMSKGEIASRQGKKGACSSVRIQFEDGSSSGVTRPMQIRYCGSCGQQGHNKSTCGRNSSYKRK